MYSNRYIFIYSTVMVVIVAVTLSFVAIVLKPYQQANVRTEKIQNILTSISVESEKSTAKQLYEKFVKQELIVRNDGSFREGPAFDISLKSELKKDVNDREMPLFVAVTDDGKTRYIVPVWGRGLWGPLWGYVAIDDDLNTISGAIFDHKSETPGLGAEISTPIFQEQFKGKKLFDEKGDFVSVSVIKGGAPENDIHGVDAISGGTITCNGVNDMLKENFSFYINYFKNELNTLPNE